LFADQPVATYLALLALAQQACAKLWIANVDGNQFASIRHLLLQGVVPAAAALA
jgi:hypothetical protein